MTKVHSKKVSDHPDQKVRDIADDLDKFTSLDTFAISDGGKLLIEELIENIVSAIDTIANKGSELELQKFISLSATIKSKLDLLRTLTGAKKTKEDLQALLSDALKE